MKTNEPKNQTTADHADSIDAFLTELRKTDEKDRKKLLMVLILFAVFLVIYTSLMASKSGMVLQGYGILSAGFAVAFVFLSLKYYYHRRIDYSATVIQFLKQAEKRFRYWPWWELIWAVPLLVLFGTGGGFIVYGSFEKYFPGSFVPLGIYIAFFCVVIVIGLRSARTIWMKEKKSLLIRIRSVLQDFGE